MRSITLAKAAPLAAPTGRRGSVLLYGEVLADVFPERTILGGAPFNVARHLKAFGLNPVLVSRLGDDALCQQVLSLMGRSGMETLGLQYDKSHPTGRVKVLAGPEGNQFEILPLQAYDFIHPAVARMTILSANPELVYFGTLAQRCETSRRALHSILRTSAAKKFLDVNLRAPWYDRKSVRDSLRYADVLKLNAEELAVLAELCELAGDAPAQAAALIAQFDLQRVIVTCGEEGAWQLDREGRRSEATVEQAAVPLVDTVGAGDGFAAVCILGALRRWPMARTLARANEFAASVCGIRGAVPEDVEFYEPFIAAWGL